MRRDAACDTAAVEPATIAGYPAHWARVELKVEIQTQGEGAEPTRTVPALPIELYMLRDPERSIDAEALLREPVVEDPPYWALLWTGARAIAAALANKPVAGIRVLDLGCGLGLSGLAAAHRGANVTFGDYLEEPLEFVRATLDRSRLSHCDVRRIDFTRTAADDDVLRYDLILAADIVYDPSHYEPLARYLDRHLADAGTILLTESLRADATVFLAGMTARGFADGKNALWVAEDGRRERTWLHELARR
jgi:predicted nicotinamide N-methyase